MMRLLLTFCLLVGLMRQAFATTYDSDGSAADVALKIAGCADNFTDEVTIPAGSYGWTTSVLMDKSITLRGAGIGQTIIYDDNMNTGSTTSPLIRLINSSGKSYRITGIEFRRRAGPITGVASTNVITSTAHGLIVGQSIKFAGPVGTVDNGSNRDPDTVPLAGGAGITAWTNTATLYYVRTVPTADTFTISATEGGAELDFTTDITAGTFIRNTGVSNDFGVLQVSGTSTAVRIDNCRFYNLTKTFVRWINTIGVIDNCQIRMDGSNGRFILPDHRAMSGTDDGYGDSSWTEAVDWLGDRRGVYIEDCEFVRSANNANQHYGAADTIYGGGRIIARFNAFDRTTFGNHGTETGGRYRGGRFMEMHDNTVNFDYVGTPKSRDVAFDYRSGTAMVFRCKFTGTFNQTVKFNSYRVGGGYPPWGQADGTKAWDVPDLTDGGGTPGGAGDGVFESGTATSVGSNTVADSTKSWTNDQWYGYTVRMVFPFTAGAGTSSGVSITIPGAGWSTSQWVGCEITRTSDGSKGYISASTSETLTLSTSYYRPPIVNGDAFVLSKSGYIIDNTATTLTTSGSPSSGAAIAFGTSGVGTYEIRRIAGAIDDSGRGATAALSGSSPYNHQDLSQDWDDQSYLAFNELRTTSAGAWGDHIISGAGYPSIVRNRNYFDDIGTAFDGTSAVGKKSIGTGTAAQMAAITPTATGVGFWVTDEGEWDSTNGATVDGQMYRWDGDSWNLYYRPYTYPHPLTVSLGENPDVIAPELTGATINGADLTLTFSESITGGAAAQFTIDGKSLSAYAGSGATRTITVSTAAANGDTLVIDYTPGDIEDMAGNALASVTDFPISNVTPEANPPSVRNPGRIRGKGKLFGK